MNTLSVIRQLPMTKKEQETFAEMAAIEILAGDVNPVEIDLRLKAMEEVIKKIRTDVRVKNYTVEEAEKYGKSLTIEGVKIEVKSRTTKDYSGCGDDVYNDLLRQLDSLKMSIKSRELMIESGVNPETGETYFPPKTETSTFLTYKF